MYVVVRSHAVPVKFDDVDVRVYYNLTLSYVIWMYNLSNVHSWRTVDWAHFDEIFNSLLIWYFSHTVIALHVIMK